VPDLQPNPVVTGERGTQVVHGRLGQQFPHRQRAAGEGGGDPTAEHDPQRPVVDAVGVGECGSAAQNGDLVQVVV
jgi:hypothetical protein